MAEAVERVVELASGATQIRVSGQGRGFLWTHGFTSSMADEDALGTSRLFGGLPGVQLVRYDARGHGRSAPGRDEAASAWSALALDLLELSEHLGLEHPIAGGASMGTATTLHAAVRAPGHFEGLVLVVPPTAWETRKAQADLYRGGAAMVEARGVEGYLEVARAAYRLRPLPGVDLAMYEKILESMRGRAAADLARILRGAAASDLPDPEALRSIHVPALIVATRGDPGHPLSTAERLVELLPNAELRVIDSLLELGSVRDELARFLTAPGARFARSRADQIDVYSPDRYAAGAPYADFARLRRERPVHWQPTPDGGGYWALTRHADVAEVSSDPERFSSAAGFVVIEPLSEAQLGMMRFTLLGMDPPEHLRFRRLLQGSFTPRLVAALEPRVRKIARAIFARAGARREVEFVEDVAAELPSEVFGEMLGVPPADRARVRGWAAQLTGSQDSDLNPAGAEAAPAASIEMAMYAIGLAAELRGKSGSDLTTIAVNGQVDGAAMTDGEFGGFFVQLATAGNDTTRNLLSSGLRLMLEHPAAQADLRADPSLIPSAIEEMLRYESPLHYFARTASRDTVLRGQAIRAGQKVALLYGAANRDPEVFTDPERFDIRRSPNPHLSFGFGEHFCLGAALARLEARVFFEELFAAFPHVELAGEPRHQRSNLNNALKALPVRLYSAGSAPPGAPYSA